MSNYDIQKLLNPTLCGTGVMMDGIKVNLIDFGWEFGAHPELLICEPEKVDYPIIKFVKNLTRLKSATFLDSVVIQLAELNPGDIIFKWSNGTTCLKTTNYFEASKLIKVLTIILDYIRNQNKSRESGDYKIDLLNPVLFGNNVISFIGSLDQDKGIPTKYEDYVIPMQARSDANGVIKAWDVLKKSYSPSEPIGINTTNTELVLAICHRVYHLRTMYVKDIHRLRILFENAHSQLRVNHPDYQEPNNFENQGIRVTQGYKPKYGQIPRFGARPTYTSGVPKYKLDHIPNHVIEAYKNMELNKPNFLIPTVIDNLVSFIGPVNITMLDKYQQCNDHIVQMATDEEAHKFAGVINYLVNTFVIDYSYQVRSQGSHVWVDTRHGVVLLSASDENQANKIKVILGYVFAELAEATKDVQRGNISTYIHADESPFIKSKIIEGPDYLNPKTVGANVVFSKCNLTDEERQHLNNMDQTIIVQTDSIGDAMMFAELIHYLKTKFNKQIPYPINLSGKVIEMTTPDLTFGFTLVNLDERNKALSIISTVMSILHNGGRLQEAATEDAIHEACEQEDEVKQEEKPSSYIINIFEPVVISNNLFFIRFKQEDYQDEFDKYIIPFACKTVALKVRDLISQIVNSSPMTLTVTRRDNLVFIKSSDPSIDGYQYGFEGVESAQKFYDIMGKISKSVVPKKSDVEIQEDIKVFKQTVSKLCDQYPMIPMDFSRALKELLTKF